MAETGVTITELDPPLVCSTGSQGALSLTVVGSGFSKSQMFRFGGTTLLPKQFDILPNGNLKVVVPANKGGAPQDFKVVDDKGQVLAQHTLYYYTPEITSVQPATGPISGFEAVTAITIKGKGFLAAQGVQFDLTASTDHKIVSDTEITCNLPSTGIIGPVVVSVIIPDDETVSLPDGFAYNANPYIKSLSPAGGPNAGGEKVTISGFGFSGVSKVIFGRQEITLPEVHMSDGDIVVTAPAGDGTVGVMVCRDDVRSDVTPASQYRYDTLPLVINTPPSTWAHGLSGSLTAVLEEDYKDIPKGTAVTLVTQLIGGHRVYSKTAGGYFFTAPEGVSNQTVHVPNVAVSSARLECVLTNNYHEDEESASDLKTDKVAKYNTRFPTPRYNEFTPYDYVEFDYVPVDGVFTLTLRTSQVDQFGFGMNFLIEGSDPKAHKTMGTVNNRADTMSKFIALTEPTGQHYWLEDLLNEDFRIYSPPYKLKHMDYYDVQVMEQAPQAGQKSHFELNATYAYVLTARPIGTTEVPIIPRIHRHEITYESVMWFGWMFPMDEPFGNFYRAKIVGGAYEWESLGIGSFCESNVYIDDGSPGTPVPEEDIAKALSPVTCFDDVLETVFNEDIPMTVTVSDDVEPANGYEYVFEGASCDMPQWVADAFPIRSRVIEFTLTEIQNCAHTPLAHLPVGTKIYFGSPFFNTNTLNLKTQTLGRVTSSIPCFPARCFIQGKAFLNDTLFLIRPCITALASHRVWTWIFIARWPAMFWRNSERRLCAVLHCLCLPQTGRNVQRI